MDALTTNILNWYDLYRKVYDNGLNASSEERTHSVEIDGEIRTYQAGYTMN